jgi:hypothetical protein
MNGVSEEIIRQRAYAIWEAQGRPDGQDLEHWEQAIRELRNGTSTVLRSPKAAVAVAASSKTVRQRQREQNK